MPSGWLIRNVSTDQRPGRGNRSRNRKWPRGHVAEMTGHVPETVGHDAKNTGHAPPKYPTSRDFASTTGQSAVELAIKRCEVLGVEATTVCALLQPADVAEQ